MASRVRHPSARQPQPFRISRAIDFTSTADVELHGRMVGLVESMLALHARRAAEKNPDTQRMLQTEIAATDRRIDRLVYELYALTEEEIALVEG